MNNRYTRTAIFLHWLIGLGLIGMFAVGLYMHGLPLSPNKLQWYAWHKWAGVTLFVVILVRLAWRLSHAAPPLPDAMPVPMRLAARVAHWAMYGLMIAIPLSGWLMSSLQGFQVVWFGVLPLPDLVPKNIAVAKVFASVHMILNYSLLTLVVLHAAAALKHHFIDKDGVLASMLPRRTNERAARARALDGARP